MLNNSQNPLNVHHQPDGCRELNESVSLNCSYMDRSYAISNN